MTRTTLSTTARLVLASAALASVAGPASAQGYPPPPPPYDAPYPDDRGEGDLVIYGRAPDDAESLSQRVNYADLDLFYPADRRELRRRISVTARDLRERLGESDGSGSVVPSCRDEAERDALRRVGTIEASWVPRGSYLVR